MVDLASVDALLLVVERVIAMGQLSDSYVAVGMFGDISDFKKIVRDC